VVDKRGTRSPPDISSIAPVIEPLIKPLVEPVMIRLDRHEKLLEEVKDALAVQFRRTADMQAQLDILLTRLPKKIP
jgi:hypothetical protein